VFISPLRTGPNDDKRDVTALMLSPDSASKRWHLLWYCGIVLSILRDEHTVLTVSAVIPTSMRMGQLCLSLPSIIDRSGICRTIVPALPPDEERALRDSAATVKRHIAAIG
jgi:hypothetical protein